jgi:hypothetical protein
MPRSRKIVFQHKGSVRIDIPGGGQCSMASNRIFHISHIVYTRAKWILRDYTNTDGDYGSLYENDHAA